MVKKEINIVIDIDDDGIIQDYNILHVGSIRLKDPDIQRLVTGKKIVKCPSCLDPLELILYLSGLSSDQEWLDIESEIPEKMKGIEMMVKKEEEEYEEEEEEEVQVLIEEVIDVPMETDTVKPEESSDHFEQVDYQERETIVFERRSLELKRQKEEQALETREFTCPSCDKSFRNKAALFAHLRTCRAGPVSYVPKWSIPKVSKEQRQQEALERADYYCDLCSKIFKNKAALIAHQKSCTGFDIFCEKCGAQFETRKKLSKHMSVNHSDTQYTCYICGDSYKRKWLLEEHIARHSDPKPFKCNECEKGFGGKDTLKVHLRAEHMGSFPGYICTTCNKRYGTKTKLKRHMASKHYSEGIFCCGLCSMKFGTEKALQSHLHNIHTPIEQKTVYKCSLCAYTATTKVRIEKHQIVHTDPNNWPYSCRKCGKKFVQKHSVERHESIHSGEKNYSCPICNQAFRLSYQVKSHMLVHQPDSRPLVCQYCDKTYRDRASYNKHVRAHVEQGDPKLVRIEEECTEQVIRYAIEETL